MRNYFLLLCITVASAMGLREGNVPPLVKGLYRIDHVGLNVKDLARSAAWYKDVLGFSIVNKWTNTWMIGNDHIRLGLFLRPQAVKVDSLDNTSAITHFAILTDSTHFEALQKMLKRKDIHFDGPEDMGIMYSIFIYDPDGYQIEINTYYKKAPRL